MSLSLTSRVTLNNGLSMPRLGFGVYMVSGQQCRQNVLEALEAGYRHIDSAEWYGNESECGDSIRASGIPRQDIFYTSKLMHNTNFERGCKDIRKSIEACGLGYIDLYLLHGPYPNKQARLDAWRALEDGVESGLIKSIGVSNFGERHLRELFDSNPKIKPVVNQIDLHPFMTRTSLVQFCKEHDIVLQAWGPLARAERWQDPTLQSIAKEYERSPAQVLLRWSLQHGYVPLPKSTHVERIKSNAQLWDFELSDATMAELDGLDEYLVTDWDPIGDKSV
ncbi:putative aldo-keto reductase [Protomyces lactucae-debilis]|uniref:Putative aldo-keto reductase n=1 Tax=Protomyces lactucae-debilis TaxID=2754530 RepID=A0A1Y2FLE3_PROLT|nr:putative aldo-keto reductase [Protomyces lactucae-debilis]ORY84778.1 putative aldo-keto reductase [Protomyces lactucae-debilis]